MEFKLPNIWDTPNKDKKKAEEQEDHKNQEGGSNSTNQGEGVSTPPVEQAPNSTPQTDISPGTTSVKDVNPTPVEAPDMSTQPVNLPVEGVGQGAPDMNLGGNAQGQNEVNAANDNAAADATRSELNKISQETEWNNAKSSELGGVPQGNVGTGIEQASGADAPTEEEVNAFNNAAPTEGDIQNMDSAVSEQNSNGNTDESKDGGHADDNDGNVFTGDPNEYSDYIPKKTPKDTDPSNTTEAKDPLKEIDVIHQKVRELDNTAAEHGRQKEYHAREEEKALREREKIVKDALRLVGEAERGIQVMQEEQEKMREALEKVKGDILQIEKPVSEDSVFTPDTAAEPESDSNWHSGDPVTSPETDKNPRDLQDNSSTQ